MDAQKQIEEMEKDLYGIQTYAYMEIYPCRQKQPNEIVAEHLVRKGWIKPAEGAVVLTKEEYKSVKDSFDLLREYESVSNSLIKSNELCRKLIDDKKELKRQLEQTHKETVKKFVNLLTDNGKRQTLSIEDAKDNICDKAYIISQSHLDQVAKQFGVELQRDHR